MNLLLLALAASTILALGTAEAQGVVASPPSCRTSLDSLDAKVRQNYAGFQLEVRGDRLRTFEAMLRDSGRIADTTGLSVCYPVLASYVAWYEDPHLFVFQSQATDTATANRRSTSLRRISVSEADVRASIARRPGDPIQGIWYEGTLRIAVVPDPAGKAGEFVGVVLGSDTVSWPIGAVRAQFRRQGDGSYATRLISRNFAELSLTARIHKNVVLRLSPGMWGRAFPLATADTGLADSIDVHRPRVSVRQRSVVFSIPSHDPQHASLLDSLVRAHAAIIATRPLLIVDLRGNEGGASFMTRALHPYIATAERRATPFDSGAPVMLSSPAQIGYARRFTGTDTSAFVRSLVVRMQANPGRLVPLEEFPAANLETEPTIAGDWRAIVLVDGGTVSAAEVLVLRALRSTRTVVVGEPTAGALDYQSVQIVSLGTGDRRWALGYPTIAAHADLPQRGMRGRGTQPDVTLVWSTVGDPIAEIERRFAR